MSSRRYLTISTAIFTLAFMAWAVVEVTRNGVTIWTSAVLVYLALVGVTLLVSRGAGESPSREEGEQRVSPQRESPPVQGAGIGDSEKTAQAIILNAIRTKGKAKRHDLLPLVKMSKSTLVRLLDKMEAEGLVVQVGQRKASYYAAKEGQ